MSNLEAGHLISPDISDEEWLSRAKAADRKGEFLSAFDFAVRGSEEYPDNVWLKFQAVRAKASISGEVLRG